MTDFLVIDRPAVVDRFVTGFDDLPEIVEGIPSARMLIATGRLVSRVDVEVGMGEDHPGTDDLSSPPRSNRLRCSSS